MTHQEVADAFRQAVGVLVDEPGRIKERLLVAYAGQLSRVRPQYDLPESVADDYRALRYALSDEGMPYGYGEHAARKLEAMSEADASRLAGELFTIYTKLVAAEAGVEA